MNTCEDVLLCMQDSKFHKQISKALSGHRLGEVDSHNICRIHVHARTFDWTQPPNKNKGASGTGTGFLLESFPLEEAGEIFILTCHHVIAHCVQIRVNFSKLSSEYVEARLVGCNPDMDIALLVVTDKAIVKAIRERGSIGLKQGDSDDIRPPATVTAHGFALGKPHMQTTKGVVSGRIENPSRLQTDVAVNPGNSGGPLLDETNKVIGLVTSGMVDAQGINYVAPIKEACIIAKRILQEWLKQKKTRSITDRLPCLNCSFTKSNRVLMHDISKCNSGVYCTSVHPMLEYPQTKQDAVKNIESCGADSTLKSQLIKIVQEADWTGPVMTRSRWGALFQKYRTSIDLIDAIDMVRNDTIKEGDVVCSLGVRDETYDVDLQMTSKFEFWQDNIGFTAIFDRLDNVTENGEGDRVRLDYYRGDKLGHVEIPLYPQMNTFRKMHADTDPIKYMVIGGIFTMSLLHNHIPLFRREPMYTLMTRPDTRHESILILTHILPESPFNDCETIGAGDVLVAIGNHPTFTLEDCRRAWEAEMSHGPQHVITLRMRDGSLASATVKHIQDNDDRITKQYNQGYSGFYRAVESAEYEDNHKEEEGASSPVAKLRVEGPEEDDGDKDDENEDENTDDDHDEEGGSDEDAIPTIASPLTSEQASPIIGRASARLANYHGAYARRTESVASSNASDTRSFVSDLSDPESIARSLLYQGK